MAIDTTPYEIHDHPNTPMRFVVAAFLVAMVFVAAAALPTRNPQHPEIGGVLDPCGSPTCISPRQFISANEARRMKRGMGDRALVVDIRASAEAPAGLHLGSDARIPFMEFGKDSDMEFRVDFGANVDDALRAARMSHDGPVILMSPSPERAVMAALLLQERGYGRILVMNN